MRFCMYIHMYVHCAYMYIRYDTSVDICNYMYCIYVHSYRFYRPAFCWTEKPPQFYAPAALRNQMALLPFLTIHTITTYVVNYICIVPHLKKCVGKVRMALLDSFFHLFSFSQ